MGKPRKPLRPIRVEGETAYVELTQGLEAQIDASDIDLVSGKNWYALRNRNVVYAATSVSLGGGRDATIYMHKVLSGFALTDHADGNGLNNRRANLRDATPSDNAKNRRRQANNTSGFKGVAFHKRIGLWQARIGTNRKRVHLGYYATPEEAHAHYLAASKDIHGQFARGA